MRTRVIRPGFFKNEELAQFRFRYRILFAGLWCMADREGRLEDRPLRIKGEVFPHDLVDVEEGLQLLHDGGHIVRYKVDGKRYIQCIHFKKHQPIHPREQASFIPSSVHAKVVPRSGLGMTKVCPSRSVPSSISVPSSSTPTSLAPNDQKAIAPEHPKVHPWLVDLELYLKDLKLCLKIWDVDTAWMKAYPGINIGAEIKKAQAWELANPKRKKTDRIRFLTNWLNRAQDRGGSHVSTAPYATRHHQGAEPIAGKYDDTLAERQRELEQRISRGGKSEQVPGKVPDSPGKPDPVATLPKVQS